MQKVTVPTERVRIARRLQAALEAFPVLAGTDITTITFFLTVAQHAEGITSNELMRMTGLSRSSISRNGDVLGDVHWRKNPDGSPRSGLGLVARRPDPDDPRRNIYSLTPEGARKLSAITALLEGLDKGGAE